MYIVPNLRGDEKLKYLRKSRTDDPLLSVAEVLEKHEQMLDDWVERHQAEGGPIPEENIFREVVSGETIESRPQMRELLRRVESPKIKAVMVVEPSRLSRGDLQDIGYLVKILRYTNTIVITPQYAYDLNDARDRESFERELMRGNEFLEYQKKIMGNGRLVSVEQGNYIASHAPYGYVKTTVRIGKKNRPTLEPHPDEAPVVKMIFEMYRDGLGAARITDRLAELHIPTRSGGPWSKSSIYTMLDNEHYLGKVKWNERKAVIKVKDGEVLKSHPFQEEYLLFDGLHEPIIEQELWDAVQAIRGSLPKNKKANTLQSPLAGLVKCGKCGRSMVRKTYSRGPEKQQVLPRLICPGRRDCDQATSKFDDVLDKVAEVLAQTIEDFEVRIARGEDDRVSRHQEAVAHLERRLESLRALEVKQWDEKMKHGMPDHVFERLNGPTVAEIEEVQQALYEARNSAPAVVDLGEQVVTFRAALDALKDPEAPAEQKNRLLKACIERIEYRREKVPRYGLENRPIHLDFTLRV